MDFNDILFAILLLVAVVMVIATHKLSKLGGVAAALIATCIYLGTGFYGISLLALFFVLGVASTRWHRDKKHRFKLGEEHHEERNAKQVLANGGVAAILGLIAWIFPEHQLIVHLMIACSLSSATADTMSSELGVIAGSKHYNILTWKADTKGENGVVSIEGILLGLIGSLLIALVFAATDEWNWYPIVVIVVAGTIGNIADSIFGASFERNNIIGNNAVNLLNTFIAAIAGAVLA